MPEPFAIQEELEESGSSGIHPSEVYHYIQTHRYSGIAAWVSGLLGTGILTVSMTVSDMPQRTFWQGMATMSGIAGMVAYSVHLSTERISRDYQDASDQGRANRLVQLFAPKAKSLQIEFSNPNWYPDERYLININELVNDPVKYPTHLLLYGATGKGKTTVMEYLLRLAHGEKIVITPKKEDNDFLGIPVIGVTHYKGKRYPYDYEAISEGLAGLWDEVYERNQLPTLEARQKPPLWAGIDEVPLIASNVNVVANSYSKAKSSADTIIDIAALGRSRGVRLIIAAQDQGVKALQIEGRSASRDNFGYIRLWEKAIDHCQSLINRKRLPRESMKWLLNQQIPAMYEDSFIVFPQDIYNIRPDIYGASQVVNTSSSRVVEEPHPASYSLRASSPYSYSYSQRDTGNAAIPTSSVVSSPSRGGSGLEAKIDKAITRLVAKGETITRAKVLKHMGYFAKSKQTPDVLRAVDESIRNTTKPAHNHESTSVVTNEGYDDTDERII